MLPAELLTHRTKQGKIYPRFALLDQENLELARNLIEVYAASTSGRRGEILGILEDLESEGDHRFIRGLSTLLERRCDFEVCSAIEPLIARREVFEAANKLSPITTNEKRAMVINRAAGALKLTSEEVESSLWADLDEELILKSFTQITPEELLRWYNLSLAQTLLFRATSMEFSVSEAHSLIFRKIKYLGLMYFAEQRSDGFWVTVEGTSSLFKLTEKYGTALAKLLPIIAGTASWKIKARIVMRYAESPRIYEFLLDSSSKELISYFESLERETFDSAVESNFAHRFNALKTGWTLKREPEPLIAGTSVFIPDFIFEKAGLKVYLEIAGFWTEDYLKRKLQKLKQLRETDIIIAFDKNLACSDLKEIPGKIIFFEKEIQLKPVLDHLREIEDQKIEKELAGFSAQLELAEDIVKVEDKAEEYGTSAEVIKRIAVNSKGHILIGEQLISKSAIEMLKSKVLELFPQPSYNSVAEMLEKEGVKNPELLLDAMGFAVRWKGLDADKAIVVIKNHILAEPNENAGDVL